MKKLLVLLATLSLLSPLCAQGISIQTLVRYNFTGYDPSGQTRPEAPTELAEGIKASDLSFAGAFADSYKDYQADRLNHEFLNSAKLAIISNRLPDLAKTDLGRDRYIELTVKVPAGKKLSITNVTLSGRRSADLPALFIYPKLTTSIDDHERHLSFGQMHSRNLTTLDKELNGVTSDKDIVIRLYFPCLNAGPHNRMILEEISVVGRVES